MSGSGAVRVGVIGAGIAGLSAAYELAGRGDATDVVLLEAADRIGGVVGTVEIAGRTVDAAAESLLTRRTEAVDLIRELGAGDRVLPVGVLGAAVYARGRLRPMPAGLVLGAPTRIWPLVRSGVVPLRATGPMLRDRLRGRRARGDGVARREADDRSVGEIARSDFGEVVAETLVDPIVGGIHAASADELSARSIHPALLAAHVARGSTMAHLAAAAPPPDPGAGPVFVSLPGGVHELAELLAGAIAARGVEIRTGTPVTSLDAGPDGVRLGLAGPEGAGELRVDHVVVAVPARSAAALVGRAAPRAADLLAAVPSSDVTVVTLAYPDGALPGDRFGSGFLVPRAARIGGRVPLVTACTYLDRKWPHLARPGSTLVRVSAGRSDDRRAGSMDDAEVVAAVRADLEALLGVEADPLESVVTRIPDALPVYRPGHARRVEQVERALAETGRIAIAGAHLRGVGVPACIASGRHAARALFPER